jgi:hypothetical protein
MMGRSPAGRTAKAAPRGTAIFSNTDVYAESPFPLSPMHAPDEEFSGGGGGGGGVEELEL